MYLVVARRLEHLLRSRVKVIFERLGKRRYREILKLLVAIIIIIILYIIIFFSLVSRIYVSYNIIYRYYCYRPNIILHVLSARDDVENNTVYKIIFLTKNNTLCTGMHCVYRHKVL